MMEVLDSSTSSLVKKISKKSPRESSKLDYHYGLKLNSTLGFSKLEMYGYLPNGCLCVFKEIDR